jgi:hypothetical protein
VFAVSVFVVSVVLPTCVVVIVESAVEVKIVLLLCAVVLDSVAEASVTRLENVSVVVVVVVMDVWVALGTSVVVRFALAAFACVVLVILVAVKVVVVATECDAEGSSWAPAVVPNIKAATKANLDTPAWLR